MDLKIIRTKKVALRDMININELEKYELPERVYHYYKGNTKGNSSIGIEDCKKKLIRNIILSYEAPQKKGLGRKRVFYYGCLLLQVNIEERSFCYIENKVEKGHSFRLNKEKKKTLNYIMGIEN